MANNNRIHEDLYIAARALDEIHRMYGQNSLAHTSTKYQFLPQTTKRISEMMLTMYQRGHLRLCRSAPKKGLTPLK